MVDIVLNLYHVCILPIGTNIAYKLKLIWRVFRGFKAKNIRMKTMKFYILWLE